MIDTTSPSKVEFKSFDNDFLNVLQYTLSNGLQLLLKVNKDEPRIFTNIAIRSGSKQDPAETTGLAHYMEHMLFKGTSKIGTLDWEKEKVLLEKISDLYEQHRQTNDPEEKKAIYKAIDQTSYEAAQLAAANEYDKLASAIGAQKTNAYTWVEQTVYVNEIPSNEVERWMELESERFKMMALRLFHTELETVYEEFNITQDNDYRKTNKRIRETLFPSHPYGTQTTIGTAQDLKNPSHVNIQWYFNTYYVPNNMAIVMSGDFDPEEVVKLAERYFGSYQAKPVPPFTFEQQPNLTEPVRKEVVGKDAAYVQMAWRLGSAVSDNTNLLILASNILYNNKAGLIDINLNQTQQVLQSAAFFTLMEDYAVLNVYGRARNGQDLEEVESLLLAEVKKLQTGDFEDWLIEAVINDLQLERFSMAESNANIVQALTNSYVLGIDWQKYVDQLEQLKKVTKADIIEFANNYLGDRFVSVFKRQGVDDKVIKVEKPEITAIPLDRNTSSAFAQSFLAKETASLSPTFVDFDAAIQRSKLNNGIQVSYVANPNNSLARLDFIFEMGKFHNLLIPLAIEYLNYLGTSRYSSTQIQQHLFRLGLSLDYYSAREHSYITLSGLEKSVEQGMELLNHILNDIQPNEAALQNVKDDILKKRENAKKDRNYLLNQGLMNYGRYGGHSPISYKLNKAALNQITSKQLIDLIKSLFEFPHEIYYYGQNGVSQTIDLLNKHHNVPVPSRSIPVPMKFEEFDNTENQVFIFDFPIIQTDILMLSKGTPNFDLEEFVFSEIYNEYFGYGLSSVVFQEIREAKALAYSTYAFNATPEKIDRAHYLRAYVGTQPDKLIEAIGTMRHIIEEMPVSLAQIEHARQSIIKKIESERIIPSKRFWQAKKWADRGVHYDVRKEVYEQMRQMKAEDLIRFQQERIKNRKFNFMLLGDKQNLDMDYLSKIGPVKVITLDDIFGTV